MKKRRMIILFSILAFVMVLVALNSFVFSIQEVRAECYNSLDTTLYDEVVQASGIQKNKNILTVNENKAIENIHKELAGIVRVVNIERKFPDKVWIHFVKLVPVVAIQKDDGDYVTCDNNLNIINASVPAASLLFDSDISKIDADRNANDPDAPLNIVRVVIKGSVINPAAKQPLALSDANSIIIIRDLINTINRLNYREYDFVRLLREIDITNYDDAVNPNVTLKMREGGGPGITIIIQNTKKLLLNKVQHAISAYDKYLEHELSFTTTVWTVYNNTKNEIIIAG